MAKSQISREWDVEACLDEANQVLVATFADGVVVKYDFAALPDVSKIRCGIHGMNQKEFDSIAGELKKGTTLDEIRGALQEQYDMLLNGEWFGTRESGGTGITLLSEAVSRALGVTVEQAAEVLKAKTAEERKAFGEIPEVKSAIVAIRAERAAAKAAEAPTDAAKLDALRAAFAKS